MYCSRCGYREAIAKGRCRGCYAHHRKYCTIEGGCDETPCATGNERPIERIVRHYERTRARETGRSFSRVIRDAERRVGQSLEISPA